MRPARFDSNQCNLGHSMWNLNNVDAIFYQINIVGVLAALISIYVRAKGGSIKEEVNV